MKTVGRSTSGAQPEKSTLSDKQNGGIYKLNKNEQIFLRHGLSYVRDSPPYQKEKKMGGEKRYRTFSLAVDLTCKIEILKF